MSELKRYSASCCFHPSGTGCSVVERDIGYWVKHEDAAAEIERLRAMVKAAYEEGFNDGWFISSLVSERRPAPEPYKTCWYWDDSKTRVQLGSLPQ